MLSHLTGMIMRIRERRKRALVFRYIFCPANQTWVRQIERIGYKHLITLEQVAQPYEKEKCILILSKKAKQYNFLSFHSYDQYYGEERDKQFLQRSGNKIKKQMKTVRNLKSDENNWGMMTFGWIILGRSSGSYTSEAVA